MQVVLRWPRNVYGLMTGFLTRRNRSSQGEAKLYCPSGPAGRARAAAGPTVRSKSAFELGLP